MRCRYCFYHDVSNLRQVKSFGMMTESTAENLIKKAFAFADGESVAFAFQGGEPLLAGLDYFKSFVRLVRKHNEQNSTVFFGLQTNGTLVTDEWAAFFRENDFLIGLSLDGGYKDNHFRLDRDGSNTYEKVIAASELLKKHGVSFNILTVLTGYCAEHVKAREQLPKRG